MIKSWAIYCSWSTVKYSWTCNIYIIYIVLHRILRLCVSLHWLYRSIQIIIENSLITLITLWKCVKPFIHVFWFNVRNAWFHSITWCDTITKDKRMVLSLRLTSAKQFIWHCQAYEHSAVSVKIIRSLYFLWYIKFRWRPSSAA